MVMERSGSVRRKPVLALLVLLACLLLPLVSAVPLSRSMSLRSHKEASAIATSGLEVPVQGEVTASEARNMGEVAARMDIEVNDYPGSSANGRHEPPRSPGRA